MYSMKAYTLAKILLTYTGTTSTRSTVKLRLKVKDLNDFRKSISFLYHYRISKTILYLTNIKNNGDVL